MKIIESSSVAGVINRSFDNPELSLHYPDQILHGHIVFPDFQRPYCWSLNDIQKILDDIDELRYSPREERYLEDEYYLGSICIMPMPYNGDPDHVRDIALLDGQQRLTSLMILARVLYDRAMESMKPDLRKIGSNISEIMGQNLSWKKAFLYREPVTQRQIRLVYQAMDREYRQLETDAALDGVRDVNAFSFYEKTLYRDLQRFQYILLSGRVAVTVLNNLTEAEQYFQGENNRGLPMSLLDILKAYHMRFETTPDRVKEILRIWGAFNDIPSAESGNKNQDNDTVSQSRHTLAKKKLAVETHVIPALLMKYGIKPWPDTANIPQNAYLLKGIVGTHRHDRIVDRKLSASKGQNLYDLLEPVQTGFDFFKMLEQYRLIDEALDTMEYTAFNPASNMSLTYDQGLILRLALIAWVDRFAPISSFDSEATVKTLVDELASDDEFRAYARHFARFLNRLRNKDSDKDPGAFVKLKKESILRCLRYYDVLGNLIFLPHRSETPAACKRAFISATTPAAMVPYITNSEQYGRYVQAYKLETPLKPASEAANNK